MKMCRATLIYAALAFFLIGATSASAQDRKREAASDQEQKIACKDVPAPVRAAFDKAYPKAVIKACAKEVEKGRTAYEISSRDDKTSRDVLFYPDGAVVVVEEVIDFETVPEPVRQAVRQKFPGGEVRLAEKLTRDDAVMFEFRIRNKDKFTEAVFDPSGNEVKL